MGESLRVHVQPVLRRSALILSFRGWNDAGEAASRALRFVEDAIQAVPLADFDPELFYDFTTQRPQVHVGPDGERAIAWPSFGFRYGSVDTAREVVTGLGDEPNLRWPSFCDCVVDFCHQLGLRQVVLLGAYLADVVYSRPVQVTGFATDSEHLAALGVAGSDYEGPTGIVGVLGDRLGREGISVMSLWAGLPHYIPASPNPRGSLALLQKLAAYLDLRFDEAPLRIEAAEFEQKISQWVSADTELTAYVKELKRRDFVQ